MGKQGVQMILCFDIGGSRIKAAIWAQGGLTHLGDTPTPAQDLDAFVAALRRFVPGGAVTGIAISIAGVVDPSSGRIKVANVPCIDGRALADDLGAALGLPILVLNDADCFAMAEARHGAGRGHPSVFGVILGTGVGGGLVVGGALVSGPGGYAGEWGHAPVIAAPWDFPCGCGLRGCIDAVCSARGLEKLHLALCGERAPSTEIVRQWRAGGDGATVTKWLDLLAPPLAMVINVTGASSVPVGGGLSNDAALIAALDIRVRQYILRATTDPLVIVAQCGPDAGLIGAAEAGQERFGT